MSVLYHFSMMPAHPVSWWRHVLTPLGMWPGATLSHQLSKTTERVITSECCQVPGQLAWHQVLSSSDTVQQGQTWVKLGTSNSSRFWGDVTCHIKDFIWPVMYLHFKCIMTILDCISSYNWSWAWAWEYYTGWPLLHCPMPDVVTLWPLCPWSPHYRVKLSNSLTEVHIFLHSVPGSALVIKI